MLNGFWLVTVLAFPSRMLAYFMQWIVQTCMPDSKTSDYTFIPTFEAHLPPITNVSLDTVQMPVSLMPQCSCHVFCAYVLMKDFTSALLRGTWRSTCNTLSACLARISTCSSLFHIVHRTALWFKGLMPLNLGWQFTVFLQKSLWS